MGIFEGESLMALIRSVGYIGLFGIVFAESGLFFGFFLPGDSLLFTAGFLASQGYLSAKLLVPIILLAAILGVNVGYMFGKKVGPRLFYKEDSLFFNKKHLMKAERFYEKYGPMTIIIARFMPVVRTFAPIVAGIGNMNYKIFLVYNIIGGILWTFSLVLGGFYLSRVVPNAEKHLETIIMLIIVVSLTPAVFHIIKEKMSQRNG